MTKSMTAFARREARFDWGSVQCEIKSVNQRHLDINFRLPESLRDKELALRDLLRKKLHRGKVDCSIRIDTTTSVSGDGLTLNQQLVADLVASVEALQSSIPGLAPVAPLDLLRWPGVVQEQEPDDTTLSRDVDSIFATALDDLIDMRSREGSELKRLIDSKLDEIAGITTHVRTIMPDIISAYRERLVNRLDEIKAELDQGRLEQEMVYLAQKADVAEELDRLESHLEEVRRVLASDGAIGRRLDFLMQELNREANTLSSKSIAANTTFQAVELKVLIEQMREQIQNIE